MKILFLTDNYPPEVNAPATRTFEHCREWRKQGHDVTVITCAPNFPKGELYYGYKNKIYSVQQINGIRIIRVWSFISANEGFIKRSLDYLSFAVSSFFCGLFQDCDVIIGTSPQFFVALSARFLAKFKRKPWILEVRDLWPDSIRHVGAMKDGYIFQCLSLLELYCYKRANLIIVVTNSFVDEIARRGVCSLKIKVVKNGANLELYKPKPKNIDLISNLSLNDRFVVGYIGTHGMAHGLDFVVKTIAKLNSPEFHFIFIGEGSEKHRLIQLAQELKCRNITFLHSIEKDAVPDYLSVTDAVLIPLRNKDLFTKVIPSKIFESAAMEKPILLGVDGEARKIIETYQAGIFFEPENEKSFLNSLIEIKQDKLLYQQCKKGCRLLADDYDRKKLAMAMLRHIEDLQMSPHRSRDQESEKS